MRIGEAARRTGCTVETVRYYERIGLLEPASRGSGGQRHYAPEQIRQLGLIRGARTLGFSLQRIRSLLSVLEQKQWRCEDVNRIAAQHLAEVRRQRRQLQNLERQLDELTETCRLAEGSHCPIVESLDSDYASVNRN